MQDTIFDWKTYGKIMILIGLLVAAPLGVLPFFPKDNIYVTAFALPALFSLLAGSIMTALTKKNTNQLQRVFSLRQSCMTVLLAWLWGVFLGALPFVFGLHMTFVQSIFESMSGWTTTGLSVIDVAKAPKIYLFHRSFMQYCGGLGFIMIIVMLSPNKKAMNLYNAEGHPDKLMPNLTTTAQTIFLMYGGFLVAGVLAYRLVGMNFFEGICHAMCSLSTGGFSTRLDSIGEYKSFPIELVTIVLMLIGTTNFAALLLLTRKKWQQFFKVSEVRFMFLLLAIFVPLTGFSLMNGLHMSLAEGMRRALFDIVSALSTSGYSSMSYTTWPSFAKGVLLLIMLIGGGIGSTAGGIKMVRVYLLLRLAWTTLKKKLSIAPYVEAPFYTRAQGRTPITSALWEETGGFVILYLIIFITGSLLLTLTAQCGVMEAMFEFASALGTVGLSIGVTGPTTCNSALLVETVGMLLGRLEIYIVLIAFTSFRYK